MEEYKSEAHILIENSKEKDEPNNNESIETAETKDSMNIAIIDNPKVKDSEKDQSAQKEDNESSTTNSRKSSLNSIQDNLNDSKTPMTISMEDLDDEKEIEFKRILLSVDFEDQCEKVENDEKVMKPSEETNITVNGQSDPFRRRSETYTISPLSKPKINRLSKLKTSLVRIGCVLLILGVLTGIGFTIANMFGWEFSHSSQNVEGVKLKQVEMTIHSYRGVGPCGSEGGVLTKLHHKSDYCEVSPSGPFDAGATINWNGTELGDCNNFKFDPNESTIDFYIKTNRDDKFCPTSVKIVLDDGKDTTYIKPLPNGFYHNKGERDEDKYTAHKSTN